MREKGCLRGSEAQPCQICIFLYWPLNKVFLRGSECIVFCPQGCCVLGQQPGLVAGPRSRHPPGPRLAAGTARSARSLQETLFFSSASKFTGFNAADLGAGPVPLRSQEESWRRPGCSRPHKPAHFYFFTRISSTSLLSCII